MINYELANEIMSKLANWAEWFNQYFENRIKLGADLKGS